MNIATSEPSLYQLTQSLDQALVPLSVGAETLKSYVSSVIELLITEQLQVTVWVKLPQTKSWLNQLQRLQREGNVESIFICSSQKNHPAVALLKKTSTKTPVITLQLNQNSTLQRESFLIVSAANFCSLVVAQWQKSKIQINSSGKRLQQPYLEMVSSFSPQAINPILQGIKHNVLKFGNLRDEDFRIAPDLEVKSDLLSKLIIHQVNQKETLQTALNSISKTSHIPEQSSTILGLQEDFLNNLVQELRSPITLSLIHI